MKFNHQLILVVETILIIVLVGLWRDALSYRRGAQTLERLLVLEARTTAFLNRQNDRTRAMFLQMGWNVNAPSSDSTEK